MTWSPTTLPALPDAPRLDPAAEHDLVQKMLRQVAERETPGGTRTEVAPPTPPDGPRARVQVVEAGSGAAIAAAAALDVARGERLGVADERGEFLAGDYAVYEPGSVHGPDTLDGDPCWTLFRLDGKVRFGGWRGALQRIFG